MKQTYKTFTLFYFYENGCAVQIQTRICRNGSFCNKGVINIDPDLSIKSAKKSAKKRGLGFHLISLDHKGMGYHHVNENDVVCIPIYIHNVVPHSLMDESAQILEGVLG